jgi:sporulation protein YtfJ
MGTTLENIKDMVDVNTVVGDPVQTGDGTTIIPISRVSFGFVAGGGEYGQDTKGQPKAPTAAQNDAPFAGGTGAGVSVQPMGFLVAGNGQVRLLSTNYLTPVDRVMELLPQMVGDLKQVLTEPDEPDKKRRKEDLSAYGFTATPDASQGLAKELSEGPPRVNYTAEALPET